MTAPPRNTPAPTATTFASSDRSATSFVATGSERLDQAVARMLPDVSRAAAQRLILQGAITVDGKPLKPSTRPAAGATVDVCVPPASGTLLQPEAMALEVVYEDADMVVIDKPAGLVVHPGAGHSSGTLVHGLLAQVSGLSGIGGVERPGIVHRLDRDTSGLIMVAKNDRAHASLSEQLADRSVRKHYLALLRGAPSPSSGLIDAPIGRDPGNRQRMAIVTNGRAARTAFTTLAVAAGHSLIAARLETGRTHQLRVHFASLGCPIEGDPLYGPAPGPAPARLCLHAWRLQLARPCDGELLTLEAPLPPALQAAWEGYAAAGGTSDISALLNTARRWACRSESRGERQNPS